MRSTRSPRSPRNRSIAMRRNATGRTSTRRRTYRRGCITAEIDLERQQRDRASFPSLAHRVLH